MVQIVVTGVKSNSKFIKISTLPSNKIAFAGGSTDIFQSSQKTKISPS